MMHENILIIGCGRIGTRLGLVLAADGHTVHGMRRRPESLPAPLQTITADATDAGELAGKLPPGIDRLYIILTPGAFIEAAYRETYVGGVTAALAALSERGENPHRVIFVSSTSVYGQDAGEWVDETSTTAPHGFAGHVLLEAERRLVAGPFAATTVHCAGIYGAGRDRLVRRVREELPCPADPPAWSNRIHEDDVVGFLAHLQTLAAPAGVYLAADDTPAPRHEVVTWLAARLGLPEPPLTVNEGGANKRCRNARMRASGYRLRFPGYRDGYAAMLGNG